MVRNRMKHWKIGIRVLVEFCCLAVIAGIFCGISSIGIAGIRQIGKTVNEKVEIVETSGMEITEEGYYTKDDDPWIVVSYDPGCILNLNLELKGDVISEGKVYYAGEDCVFSERKFQRYTFKNGENLIDAGNANTEYLRLDITGEAGYEFQIVSISQTGKTGDVFKNINYVFVIFISLTITFLLELVRMWRTGRKRVNDVFTGILLLSILLIFGQFITGRAYFMYSDIGWDTINQYYPYYVNVALSIREGTFGAWNWDYGLGTSLMNSICWTLDPFAWIAILPGVLFGAQVIQHALIWMHIVKIFAAYFLCKRYMKLFTKNETAVCLAAYLYSLNGYLMLWGQHYFLGTASIYILLVLLAVEKFVRYKGQKESVWLALSVAVTLASNYYNAYMILAVAAVYFFIRWIALREDGTFRSQCRIFGKCVVSVAAGMCLSGIVFVPAAYYTLTNSTRVSGASGTVGVRLWQNILSTFDPGRLGTRLSRLMSNNVVCIYSSSNTYFGNYYEAPQLVISIFIFFFLGQWLIYAYQRAKKEKLRILFAVTVLLFLFFIFSDATGMLLNGLAYAAFRYTFTIFPFFALVIACVWEQVIQKGRLNIWGLVIGLVLSLITWVYSCFNVVSGVKLYVLAASLVLVLGTVLLFLVWRTKKYRKQMVSLFMLLVIFSATMDAFVTINYRSAVTEDSYSLQWIGNEIDNDTIKAMAWIKEQDESFYRLEKTYYNWTSRSDSFLEKYSGVTWYNSTPNSNIADFYNYIYNSSENNDHAKFFDISSERFISAVSLVNVKYILSAEKLEYSWCEEVYQQGNIYVYRNLNTDSVAKWYSKVITKEAFEGLSEAEQNQVLDDTLIMESDADAAEGGSMADIGTFSLNGRNGISGEVTCDDTGFLMIAIPDQEGWSVYVDGEKVTTYNADYGFMAVKLTAGEHQIETQYRIPKVKEGLFVSVLGFIMVGALGFMEFRRRNASDNRITNK